MKSLAAVWLLSLLFPLTTGCDPMTSVTFVNETQEELQFYEGSSPSSNLAAFPPVSPGTSYTYDRFPAGFKYMRVAATREDGQWVFDHAYTRDELERAKMRVVVSSLEPIAPAIGVTVVPYPGAPAPVLPSVMPKATPAPSPTPSK